MPAHGANRRARCGRRRRCRRIRRSPPHLSAVFLVRLDDRGLFITTSSAKPRAMNRTGLFIALALALVVGLLFGIYPELDLKLAALFYDPATKSFPLKFNTLAAIARDAAMWIAWGLALPAIVALVVKLVRPDRPMLMSGRAVVFLLVTLLLSAGVLTNLTFKSYWGRPRPVMVTQFNGPHGHSCRGGIRAAHAGATVRSSPARAPPRSGPTRPRRWRRRHGGRWPMPRRPCSGSSTSVLRMAFGGHFFTDVAIAGLVTFLVIWLAYGYIYRWPSTRLTDEAHRRRADAAGHTFP